MVAKGFGWVGRVDWEDAPPILSVDVKRFLDDALDQYRFSQVQTWLGLLVPQHSAIHHPINPTTIVDAVSDPDVVVYIANAHGDHRNATLRKVTQDLRIELKADQHIKPAMAARGPMKFAFLIHSEGMVNRQDPSWAYDFRKGQDTGTVAIGIRGGAGWDPQEAGDQPLPKMTASQWATFQLLWTLVFFLNVSLGFPFKNAFYAANYSFPNVAPYMVFNGDETMTKADLT